MLLVYYYYMLGVLLVTLGNSCEITKMLPEINLVNFFFESDPLRYY